VRLFGKVDGAINRFDRAGWLTLPFDLELSAPPVAPIGSIILDQVICGPSVLISGFSVPQIVFDGYDLSTDDIEVASVEVIP